MHRTAWNENSRKFAQPRPDRARSRRRGDAHIVGYYVCCVRVHNFKTQKRALRVGMGSPHGGRRRAPVMGNRGPVSVSRLRVALERVMNSSRNSLGMQETEIAREPSRLW